MSIDAPSLGNLAQSQPRKRRWLCRIKSVGRQESGMFPCFICRQLDRVQQRAGWCKDCHSGYARWRAVWIRYGAGEPCPLDLVEERIALYQWRAERQLELFEQPLCLPVRF
jgi:hypothetical protein